MTALRLAAGAKLSSTGLELPDHLPFEQWEAIGRQLARLGSATAWAIADWLFYGQWADYGKRYEEAIAMTGLDYQTLRHRTSIAGKFAPCRRRHKLSFGHHAEVAALPEAEQDAWLDRAEQYGWSRNELRERLQRERELDAGASTSTLEQLRITVDEERLERYHAAAARVGAELNAWAIAVLDVDAAKVD